MHKSEISVQIWYKDYIKIYKLHVGSLSDLDEKDAEKNNIKKSVEYKVEQKHMNHKKVSTKKRSGKARMIIKRITLSIFDEDQKGKEWG